MEVVQRGIVLLLGGLLALSTPLTAQDWPQPVPLETSHLLGAGKPMGQPPVPLEDDLYVLAMGKSNAVAYLERRKVPGGTFFIRARILDLVEDKVQWEQSWQDWKDDFAGWWQSHNTDLQAVFRKFRLDPLDYQLGEFPVILDEEFYSALLRKTYSPSNPSRIERLEVVMASTGRGIKTVEDSKGEWQWAALAGFIPSPFENRLALVLLVQPVGWAGKEQPLRFLVTGASLKAGFEQP